MKSLNSWLPHLLRESPVPDIRALQAVRLAAGSDRETTTEVAGLTEAVGRAVASKISRELLAAMEQLPLYERAAVFLRDVERLPLRDVANQLTCSIPTARLHIAQGRISMVRRMVRPRGNADRDDYGSGAECRANEAK